MQPRRRGGDGAPPEEEECLFHVTNSALRGVGKRVGGLFGVGEQGQEQSRASW